METVVQSPQRTEEQVPVFELWQGGADPRRERQAGLISVALHAAAVLALALMPQSVMRQVRQVAHSITPLIAPPTELTQRAPNKGKISKEIAASALTPRPRIQVPPSPPSTTRPAARVLAMPSPGPAERPGPALPEPPPIAGGGKPAPQIAEALTPPAPPRIEAQEKPKLAFESPAPPPPAGGRGLGKPQTPGSAISEAARAGARSGGGGGLIIGDAGAIAGPGGIGEALNMPPSPGRQASALELLSDPQGVDFRPYLIQILSVVRRNWFAVMPESAKLGRRGRVAIQFAINRNGAVPKLVIVSPSGADALDRAAVAGISASNPFPPLPSEFRGEQVRLQFNFVYNMPLN